MDVLIQDECVSCAICAEACPEGCISEEEDQFVIDPVRCTECMDCVAVCPVDCIVTT